MSPAVLAAIVTGGLGLVGVSVTVLVTWLTRVDRRVTAENRQAVETNREAVATDRRHVDATTKSWLSILDDIAARLELCEQGRADDADEHATEKRQLSSELADRRAEIARLRASLEESHDT